MGKMLSVLVIIVTLALVFLLPAEKAKATLITGDFSHVQEGPLWFGPYDGYSFGVFWKSAPTRSGYAEFFGTASGHPSVTDYSPFLGDPKSMTNAEKLHYYTGAMDIPRGYSMFFRTLEGYYAALFIESVNPPDRWSGGFWTLTGQWYFQNDHTGNFSPVPIPGALWLFGFAFTGLVVLNKSITKSPKHTKRAMCVNKNEVWMT